MLKLQGHFNQANEDIRSIVTSAEKAMKRGGEDQPMSNSREDGGGAQVIRFPIAASMTRKLEAGE